MARRSIQVAKTASDRFTVRWYAPHDEGDYRYLARSFHSLGDAEDFRDRLRAYLQSTCLSTHRVVNSILRAVQLGRPIVPLLGDNFTQTMASATNYLRAKAELAGVWEPPTSWGRSDRDSQWEWLTCIDELTRGAAAADARRSELLGQLQDRFFAGPAASHQATILASLCRLQNWRLVFRSAVDATSDKAFLQDDGGFEAESAQEICSGPRARDDHRKRLIWLAGNGVEQSMRQRHPLSSRCLRDLEELIPANAVVLALGLAERDERGWQLLRSYATPRSNADREVKAIVLQPVGSAASVPREAAEGTVIVGECLEPSMWLQEIHVRLDNSLCADQGGFSVYSTCGPSVSTETPRAFGRAEEMASQVRQRQHRLVFLSQEPPAMSCEQFIAQVVDRVATTAGAGGKAIWIDAAEIDSVTEFISTVNRRLGRSRHADERLESLIPFEDSTMRSASLIALQHMLERLDGQRAVLVIRNVEKVAPIDAFHDVLESLVRGAKALSRSRLVFTYTHSRNSKWLADLCTDEAAEWCLAAPLKQEHLDEWNLDRLTAADEKSEPQDADPTLDGCLAALDSPALAALLVVSLSRRPCSIALVRTVVQCLCADSNRDGLSGLQVSPLEFDSSVHRLLQQARECAPLEEADSAINRLIASGVVLHHEGGMLSTSNQVEEASRRLLAERGGSNIESNFHALMSSALYDLMFQQSSDLDALREYTHHRIQSFQDSAPEAGFPRQRLALRVLWQHRRQIAQEGCSAFAHACIDCVQDMWREAGESKQREHVMRLSCDLQADLYARQHQFKLAAELRVRQIAHRVVELDYADSVGGGDRSVDLESTWVAMLFACQQVESSDAYRRLGSELSGAMDAACQHASSSKALRAISHVVNLAECWKGMREFDAADELFFSALQALRKQRPTDPFSEDAIPVLRLETQTFRLLLSSHLERIEAWNWTSQYNDRLLDVARSLYDIGHERLLDYFNQCPIHEDGGAGDQFFAKMKRDFCSLRARINVHAGSRLHSKLDDGDPSREELDRRMKEIEAEFHQSRQHYKLANTLANQISDGEMAAHVCRLVQAFALILHSDVVLRRSVADADFNDDELRLAKTLIYGVEQNLATEKQYISWWYWLAWLKTQVCHEECMWAICAERQNGEDAKAVYESLADGVSSAMTGLEFLEATDAHTDYFKVLMLQFLVCHAFYCAKSVKSLHEFKRDWVKQLEKLGQHPHRHTETPPILRALSSDEVLAPVWNLVKKVNIAKRASLRQQIIDVERQVVELGLVDLQHRPSDSVFLAEDGRLEELR